MDPVTNATFLAIVLLTLATVLPCILYALCLAVLSPVPNAPKAAPYVRCTTAAQVRALRLALPLPSGPSLVSSAADMLTTSTGLLPHYQNEVPTKVTRTPAFGFHMDQQVIRLPERLSATC